MVKHTETIRQQQPRFLSEMLLNTFYHNNVHFISMICSILQQNAAEYWKAYIQQTFSCS